MSEMEQKEKMLKRVEFGKYALKKKYENIISQLGVYEVEYTEYPKLQKIIFLSEKYFEKYGIQDRDINKLPNKLRKMLISNFYKAVNKRVSSLSEESKIFFMVDMHAKYIDIKETIETKDAKEVIYNWTKQIMLAIVSGYMGTGKTDFSLKIAEWLWTYGDIKYIISNIGATIEDSKYAPFYFEISTLSELLMLMYRYKDTKKVFIFDEASIHVSHRRAMGSNNISIINIAKLIRKLNTHFILISQRAGGVDKDLRDLATLWIHKEKKERVSVKECVGEEQKTYYIDGIGRTEIKYDTNDPADFIFDLPANDIQKVMRLISKNISYEEFENEIKKLVDEEKNRKSKDKHKGGKTDEYIKEDKKEDAKTQHNSIYQCTERIKKQTDEDKILSYLSSFPNGAKLKDIMSIIGKGKSRTHEIITELKKKGLVYIEGTGKKSVWVITDAGKYYVENR